MSREHKYRVYIPDTNKFVYFGINDFDYSDRYLDDGKYPIQQYTGLTDKNKKEIYEGDIIIDTQKQKYEIIFDENHARYDLKVCGENKLSQTSYGTKIYEKKHIEVIGNIFEHSELLN